MKKVIRITTILDFGGVERRLVNVSQLDLNFEKIFVSLSHGGWAEKEINKNGCRVICLGRNPRIPNFNLIWKLVRFFKQEKPSVVHCSGAEANFHGLIAAWLARVPVRIGEEIGFPKHNVAYRFIFRLVYTCAHYVIGVSRAVCNRLIELKEINMRKAVVVYSPVDTRPEVARAQSKQSVVRLITVSRLTSIKNIDTLLKVVKEVHSIRALELHIVGDGPAKEHLVNLTLSLELNQIVTFHGFNDKPLPIMANSDIFVLLSFSEGLSNSILEAFSIGLLCLATNVGGLPEIIEHEKNGWLVDPHNAEAIKQLLVKIIDLPENEADQVRLNARKTLEHKFSPEAHAVQLRLLYENKPVG